MVGSVTVPPRNLSRCERLIDAETLDRYERDHSDHNGRQLAEEAEEMI